jgi:hypothetical protein
MNEWLRTVVGVILTGSPKLLENILSQCNFFHHQFCMDSPEIKPRPTHLWHGFHFIRLTKSRRRILVGHVAWVREMHSNFWSESLNERNNFEDLGVGGVGGGGWGFEAYYSDNSMWKAPWLCSWGQSNTCQGSVILGYFPKYCLLKVHSAPESYRVSWHFRFLCPHTNTFS